MTFFKKFLVQDPEIKFQRLEMKINALMAICVVQTLMLACLMFAEMFVPSTFTMFVILIATGVALYLFRQQLPSVIGSVFRFVTNRGKSEVTDSGDTKFH